MAPAYSHHLKDYPVEFVRQQRIFGPIDESVQPPPGSEIYIHHIPDALNEDAFFELVKKAGNVYQMRIMMLTRKSNRGFCYVTYTNPEEATAAVQLLDHVPFMGCYLAVQKSFDNSRLFIGGIPEQKSKDDVWMELIRCGMKNIQDVIMYRSYSDRAKNRGFVFVDFGTHQKAAEARMQFKNLKLFGLKIIVDWSTPLPDIDETVLSSVSTLFLRNLPVTLEKEDFERHIMKALGPMILQKVFKFKDYSFIHFISRKDAEVGLQKLKDYYAQTNVEVSWAIPPKYAPKKRILESPQQKVHNRFNNVSFLDCPPIHYTPGILLSNPISYVPVHYKYFENYRCSPLMSNRNINYNQFTANCGSSSTPARPANSMTEDSSLQLRSTEASSIPDEYVPKTLCNNSAVYEKSSLDANTSSVEYYGNVTKTLNRRLNFNEYDNTRDLVQKMIDFVLHE